jgi:serine/threonine-protein kinase HipA
MAEIVLHGPANAKPSLVGWISRAGDTLRVSFAPDYVGDPKRLTLSQLYTGNNDNDTRKILTAVNDERLVRIGKLPSYFSNLLPEGVNRTRLAEQRGVDEGEELELLAAAGHDLIGALEILPATDVPRDVLELHTTQGLEPLQPNAVEAPMDDGFSAGGFVTKFSMVHEGRRYIVRRGTDAGDILAKLPSTRYPDMVRNEATCYRLAEAVGVKTCGATARPITELELPVSVPFDEYLNVPRFDRKRMPDGSHMRVHFEELTQALGEDPRHKYRNLPGAIAYLLNTLKGSSASNVHELDEVFRRWTAYALMGNTDAHGKNWGLIYRDGVNPQLAPAYDVVCVSAYFDPASPRGLGVNRAMDVSLRAWNEDAAEALAKDAGLLQYNRMRRIVRETMKDAALGWPTILEDDGVPPAVRAEITERLQSMVPAASVAPVVKRAAPKP